MNRTNSKRKPHNIGKHEIGPNRLPAAKTAAEGLKSHVPNIDANALRRILDEAREALAAPESDKIATLANNLTSTPRMATIEAIHEIGHDFGEKALPLLEVLAASSERELAIAAIQVLGATRTERAAEILANLEEKSRNREMQKEARRSLFKLKSAGIKVEPAAHPREETAKIDLHARTLWKAYMTNPDGEGSQAFDAASEGPFGGLDTFNLLINDATGIKDFSHRDSSKKALQKMVERIEAIPGFSIIEIPLDYFRYRINQAYELSKANGITIPPAFYKWRSLIAEPEEAYEQHPIYHDISLVEIKWNPELLEQSPEIIKNEEFISWLLPAEQIKGYVADLAAIKSGKVALPPWVEAERAESVTAEAINHFFDPEARIRYKHRLEDMAYLLFHTDRQLDAKRALAAAAAFDEQTGVPSAKHPFALALFQTTVGVFLQEQREARASERQRLITDVSQLREFIHQEPE